MSKKYVVVTGASSGIGLELSKKLSAAGYLVTGTVRNGADKQRLENEINENFGAFVLDVCDPDSIESFRLYLQGVLEEDGLYCLINNAGVAMGGPLMHLTYEAFHHQMDVNLYGVFRITNALLPLLGASLESTLPPGMIINISSVSGIFNTPMLGPYCISKHALESMSDIYRRELSVFGIRLVVIQPGPIKTPIWKKSVPAANPVLHTDYAAAFDYMAREIRKSEKKAIPAEKISKIVLKVMKMKNPCLRYLVTRNNLIFWLASKLIPDVLVDKIMGAQLKKVLKKKNG